MKAYPNAMRHTYPLAHTLLWAWSMDNSVTRFALLAQAWREDDARALVGVPRALPSFGDFNV